MVKQDLVLIKDVDYFGNIIRRGSTFKQSGTSKDWFDLWHNDRGILMHNPSIRIHITSVNEEYFVKQYA
jgi:hypothetical protein